MTRILLLEAAGPESGALVATATAMGHQVHAATTSDHHVNYGSDLRQLLSGCLITDFSRHERACDDIVGYARRVGADAVLTTNEYLTPMLAEVCAELGLPGNDPALATAARNKADMSRQFAHRGVTAPHTHVLARENQVLRLCASGRLAFPCVVKPADGAGSAGVTVAQSATEAIAAFRAACELQGMYGMSLDPHVLVQEFIEGAEYSVESITQNGVSTHLCLTRKIVTGGAHRVELGHGLPAFLPLEVEQTVHGRVNSAIAAVGIRNGASHTEVMLTPDGRCTVIEVGARLGAGHIGFLIHHALGIDPWAACLDVALGRPAQLAPTRDHYATVRFLTNPHQGLLAAITGLPERSPQVPIVRVRKAVGEVVGGAKDNAGRLGNFVVVGPDQQSVDDHADHLLAQVRIRVEPIERTSSHSATIETRDDPAISQADHG
ncbi:ATP-grasp domain-containing protein [Actinokineospora xionganensis]|uniref:ATP-grasp domain-containing protein n=1 Tax=Actinokineospora xionganensis TaxID=2684470 RepID=A0ABR7LF13_9PSEU|nr:ATP-grasp domain-containing protein [Actinokineospora xionganensis]MBC6451318.1 ATP-grasp domain-containing protein [Actinokineospora xionganensis]